MRTESSSDCREKNSLLGAVSTSYNSKKKFWLPAQLLLLVTAGSKNIWQLLLLLTAGRNNISLLLLLLTPDSKNISLLPLLLTADWEHLTAATATRCWQ